MRKMKRILEFSRFNSGINVESVDGVPFKGLKVTNHFLYVVIKSLF